MIERIILGALFLTAFFALVSRRNLIKKVYALAVMNLSVLLLFISGGESIGFLAPFESAGVEGGEMVDPVPQSLMLTAIVVGICVSSLALALISRLYRGHKTLDCEELRKEINHDAP
jgi:multicomponent Na+:H+ antiporter subunit C